MITGLVEPQVCVVLPLFGGHRAVQVAGNVVRAWLAQDVPCEVVVAVAGDAPLRLPPEFAGRARILRADAAVTSPGPLRNLAAATRAPLLYLGDADIVPLGTDFLGRALRLRGDHVVVQPWMYRLVNAAELTEFPVWQPPDGGRVCLVTGDASGRLVPVPGERFRRRQSAMLMVEPPHPRPYAGPELTANRELLARRTAAGAEAMIAADRARSAGSGEHLTVGSS